MKRFLYITLVLPFQSVAMFGFSVVISLLHGIVDFFIHIAMLYRNAWENSMAEHLPDASNRERSIAPVWAAMFTCFVPPLGLLYWVYHRFGDHTPQMGWAGGITLAFMIWSLVTIMGATAHWMNDRRRAVRPRPPINMAEAETRRDYSMS